MSKIKPINHYSITNAASVYDEEAMTALELAGKTAGKINEVINYLDEATSQIENIPHIVDSEVGDHIKDGTFDDAIDKYAGGLKDRIDYMFDHSSEGSTTFDMEILDGRVGDSGKTYSNIGDAIREQYIDNRGSSDDKLSASALKYGYRKNLNRRVLWNQGWLSSETGEHGTTGIDKNMYICTDFIPETVERVITNGHPMEVFVFTEGETFLHKVSGRFDDYTFDQKTYRYKIHVTGYCENIPQYNNAKSSMLVILEQYNDILFLADPIKEASDNVSVTAEKYGYKRDVNIRSMWSQGYIYGATGLDGTDPSGYDYWLYSRSETIPGDVERIYVEPGYKARLFKYDIKGNFIDYVVVTGLSDYLDTAYHYKLDITTTSNVLGDRHHVNDVWDKVHFFVDRVGGSAGTTVNGESVFKTDAIYRPYAHKYITSEKEDSQTINNTVMSMKDSIDDLIQYVNESWDYEVIGYDSSGEHSINAYRFKPPYADANTPKILVVGGQHGFEKGSVLGLVKMIMEFIEVERPVIIHHTELIVIPCLCPTAYDSNEYRNANGVNLNRNYDYSWKRGDEDDEYYGGESPFSEPETRALRDLILKEKPDLVIDFHSMGMGVVSGEEANVYYACGFTDPYYMKLKNVAKANLVNGGVMGYTGRIEGFDGTINNKASLDNWCAYKLNTLALTVEGHNGLEMDYDYLSDATIERNYRIIVNFICEFLAEYSRG